jgi:ankyrin repeat protein
MLAYAGQYDCVDMLLNCGAIVDIVDSSFGDLNTPLHKAILGQHRQIYDLLLSHHANPNTLNAKGENAVWDEKPLVRHSLSEPSPETLAEFPKPVIQHKFIDNILHDDTTKLDCFVCHEPGLSFCKSKSGKLLCFSCIKKDRFCKLL